MQYTPRARGGSMHQFGRGNSKIWKKLLPFFCLPPLLNLVKMQFFQFSSILGVKFPHLDLPLPGGSQIWKNIFLKTSTLKNSLITSKLKIKGYWKRLKYYIDRYNDYNSFWKINISSSQIAIPYFQNTSNQYRTSHILLISLVNLSLKALNFNCQT